jgi:hypothetical protein
MRLVCTVHDARCVSSSDLFKWDFSFSWSWLKTAAFWELTPCSLVGARLHGVASQKAAGFVVVQDCSDISCSSSKCIVCFPTVHINITVKFLYIYFKKHFAQKTVVQSLTKWWSFLGPANVQMVIDVLTQLCRFNAWQEWRKQSVTA